MTRFLVSRLHTNLSFNDPTDRYPASPESSPLRATRRFKAVLPTYALKMSDDAQAQQQAAELKAKANGLYKERKFDEARAAYEQAWQLYPKDITSLNNLGGESGLRLERPVD